VKNVAHPRIRLLVGGDVDRGWRWRTGSAAGVNVGRPTGELLMASPSIGTGIRPFGCRLRSM
jgi:hypothetical protein